MAKYVELEANVKVSASILMGRNMPTAKNTAKSVEETKPTDIERKEVAAWQKH